MSRSRKKTPIGKDSGSKKWAKRQANKKVRKTKGLFSGKDYKKLYESWDINDYICYYSRAEAIEDWYREEQDDKFPGWRHNKYRSLEEWLVAWEKMMIRK